MKSISEHSRKPTVLFLIAAIIIWLFISYGHLSNYFYRHFYIHDIRNFLLLTMITVFAPLLPIALACLFICYNKKKLSVLSLVIYFVLLGPFFLRGVSEILTQPTVCSYTDDLSDVGKMDFWVSETLQLNTPKLSLNEILGRNQITRYFYFYENSSSNRVYIVVNWEELCPDDFLLEIGSVGEKIMPDEPIFFDTDTYFKVAVFYDVEGSEITYVLTNQTNLVPKHQSDVIINLTDLLNS